MLYEDQTGRFDKRAGVHAEVCAGIRAWLDDRPGWRVLGLSESPITGPEGNKEFLIAARRGDV